MTKPKTIKESEEIYRKHIYPMSDGLALALKMFTPQNRFDSLIQHWDDLLYDLNQKQPKK